MKKKKLQKENLVLREKAEVLLLLLKLQTLKIENLKEEIRKMSLKGNQNANI